MIFGIDALSVNPALSGAGESYLRELATHFSYCNHDCYLGHCKNPDRVLQRHVFTRNARVS